MILVTGGAGFIGSNLVRELNRRGEEDVLVTDDLSDGRKFRNLADLSILDYLDKEDFAARLERNAEPAGISRVYHLGACSETTAWDGRMVMATNYEYSKKMLHWCLARKIPLVYASSAAVYGTGRNFSETPECEAPVTLYAYSKLLFDQYVRRLLPSAASQVTGLRYFNVYGPRETHKGPMASVAFQAFRQLGNGDEIRLFQGSGGFEDGCQERDFVYVDDAVDVTLWFGENPEASGIFNVGTGRPRTFNEVAGAVIAAMGRGEIRYVPFPEKLLGHYQHATRADLAALRAAGCAHEFAELSRGVGDYIAWLRETGLEAS